jgi:hypothetical protein
MSKDFTARVFLPNPGGAYDPAPLHEFDDLESAFTPAIGDIIRYGASGASYRVVSRFFDAEANRAAIFVDPWSGDWPSDLQK